MKLNLKVRSETLANIQKKRISDMCVVGSGIPTLIVKFEFGENDRLLVKDLEAHMKGILRVAGV